MNDFIQTKDITRIYLKVILFKIDRFLDFQMASNSEKLHNWNNNALQYGVTEELEIHVMGVKDLGFVFRDPFTKNKDHHQQRRSISLYLCFLLSRAVILGCHIVPMTHFEYSNSFWENGFRIRMNLSTQIHFCNLFFIFLGIYFCSVVTQIRIWVGFILKIDSNWVYNSSTSFHYLNGRWHS